MRTIHQAHQEQQQQCCCCKNNNDTTVSTTTHQAHQEQQQQHYNIMNKMTRTKEQQQQHQRYETRTTHQACQDRIMSDSVFRFDGGQSDSDFGLMNLHHLPMMKKLLMHCQLMKTFWSKHKLTIHLEMTML